MRKILKITLFVVLFFVLALNVLQMPSVQTGEDPSYNDAVNHYLDNGIQETGSTNIIAAILADYRAFDTLGETIVLFTSIVAVASVLKAQEYVKEEED